MTTSKTESTSTQAVVTALVANGAMFIAFFIAFLILRLRYLRIYQPKSSFDLVDDEKKPEPLPPGYYQWLPPLLKKSDNFIIKQAGLDGYFFIRYLGLVTLLSLTGCILLFPILFPVNASNGKHQHGMDQLAFSNVKNPNRFYAHVFLSWFWFFGILYVIYRELTYYTALRQAVLSSPRYASKLSSRTVLFQTVPDQFLDETEFKKLFDDVKTVWIARASREITKAVEKRDKMAMKLENAENALLKTAIKLKQKAEKKGNIINSSDIGDYVPQNKRPHHRLKFLIGKKVDTIDYIKEELPALQKEVEELQKNHRDNKALNSVFVEFGSQYSAQVAFQTTTSHTALHMCPRHIGVEPTDVVWLNMRMFWWERLVRKFGAVSAIIALLIFWSIPVAFVGMISNITYLTNKLPWLKFIYNLPEKLLGLLTSLAPTVALSVLMSLLPKYIRGMAKTAGAASYQQVEYFTQQSYFAFQVIQVFLITTLASSASSTVTQIVETPTKAMYLLSENLPKASNFYISYIILQGLTGASGTLLQIVNLVLFYLLGALLDKTPRKQFNRFSNLTTMSWGTVFPVFTNLAVIILTYSMISPIILLFSTVGFALLYIAYLHNLTYTYAEGPDSRGMHYPRALFQTIVGVYLGQICLLGLFVVAKAWGPVVLEAIAIGVTVFVHVNLNGAFDQLMTVVPVDTMKPLDGISNTPSYTHKQLEQHGANFDFETKAPSIHTANRDSISLKNVFTDGQNVELHDLSRFSLDQRRGIATPLLADGDTSAIPPAPFWKRFLLPHIYSGYKVAKTRIPDIYNFPDPEENNDPEYLKHAYDFPAVGAKTPYLWIPKDEFGLSSKEIESFSEIIPMSDSNAAFNAKGKPIWTGPPPSYEDATSPFNESVIEEKDESLE